jgi:prophage DNA circulation protein
MTNSTHDVAFVAQKSAEAVQALHDDIRARWSKLSDFEVGALADTDDLVTQVARLYTLDREQVQTDVSALLDGRSV